MHQITILQCRRSGTECNRVTILWCSRSRTKCNRSPSFSQQVKKRMQHITILRCRRSWSECYRSSSSGVFSRSRIECTRSPYFSAAGQGLNAADHHPVGQQNNKHQKRNKDLKMLKQCISMKHNNDHTMGKDVNNKKCQNRRIDHDTI